MDRQLLFIDFEFTMPAKKRKTRFFREIIEIGLVSVINGEIYDTFSSFVRPQKNLFLTERCKSFLNITQDQVNNGISFSKLVTQLKKYFSMCPSKVVTWGNMDMQVLRQNCKKGNESCPIPRSKQVDLSMEYKRFYGDQNQTGLWKAVKEYGKTGVGRHHSALDDALTTYEIFKCLEADKKYLNSPVHSTIGERVNVSKLDIFVNPG